MMPYVRAANVTWAGIDVSDIKEMDFTPHEQQTYRLEHGDILLSEASGSANEVGKPAIWQGQVDGCCFQNTLIRVRTVVPELGRYLHRHFLADAVTGRFGAASRGVGIHHLGAEAMSQWVVRIPPAKERERIVDVIDSNLSRLDETTTLLKRVQRNLKRYRASVLKAAVEGRLVPTEAELARAEKREYEPASVLLERILVERRQRWEKEGRTGKYEAPVLPDTKSFPELSEGWTYVRLSMMLIPTKEGMKTGPFGSLLKKHEHQAAGVPVLGIENIEPMQFVHGSKIHITDAKAEQLAGYDVRHGDLLISRSGTVGEVCVMPADFGPARLSTNVMRVRFLAQSTLPEFFALLLNGSPFVLRQVANLCKGTTRAFLNQEILDSLIFPLPPLTEQRRILDEVYRLLSLQEAVLQTASMTARRCARVRQSILKWAFEGKLVDQDPNDEPASALLARIKAEQPAAPSKKPRRTV